MLGKCETEQPLGSENLEDDDNFGTREAAGTGWGNAGQKVRSGFVRLGNLFLARAVSKEKLC